MHLQFAKLELVAETSSENYRFQKLEPDKWFLRKGEAGLDSL